MATRTLQLSLPLLMTGSVVVAAASVLGRPDPALAGDFFTSRTPTVAEAIAAAVLLIWLVILAALVSSLAAVMTSTLAGFPGRRRQRLWSTTMLIVGLVILASGAAHHYAPSPVDMHGGSLDEARQQLQAQT